MKRTQLALCIGGFLNHQHLASEEGTWGYYTKGAFRNYLDTLNISPTLKEHLNSGIYHFIEDLPQTVAEPLLAFLSDTEVVADENEDEDVNSDSQLDGAEETSDFGVQDSENQDLAEDTEETNTNFEDNETQDSTSESENQDSENQDSENQDIKEDEVPEEKPKKRRRS